MANVPAVERVTLAQALEALRTYLPADFPISNADEFGVFGTYLKLAAQARVDAQAFTADLSLQGFVLTATGGWLDAHAAGLGLERKAAVVNVRDLRVSCAAGGTVPEGAIFQTLPGSDGSTLRWVTREPQPLTAGTGRAVRVYAESPGVAHNVAEHRVATLVTALPFITAVDNLDADQVTPGADEESDEELRRRCLLRFAGLGPGATRGGYELWALTASPAITQVRVLDAAPRGQGTVDVVVWGKGGVDAAAVAAADAYIQDRRPLTADVDVYAATPVAVAVTANVYVTAGGIPAAQAGALANLEALERSLAIGAPLYRAALIEALMNPAGVVNVTLAAPLADVTPTTVQAVTLTPSLTYVEV